MSPRERGREESLAFLTAFASAALGAGLARAVTTTYLPVLLEQLRDAPGLIGSVMLVNAAAGFAVPLLVGRWSDRARTRHGRRRPFIVAGSVTAAGGLAGIGVATETSYLLLAAFGGLSYVGLNAIVTAHRAFLRQSFEPAARPRASAAHELALMAGALAGVALGGSLIELASPLPFVLAAAAVPALAAVTVVRMRGRDVERSSRSNRHRSPSYFRAALRPGVRPFLAAEILWVLAYAALPAFFILYARDVLELPPSRASLWLAGFGLVTGLALLGASRARAERWQRPLLALGVALIAVGFIGVSLTTKLAVVAVALFPAATGFGLVSALAFPVLSSMIPEAEAGTYSALYKSARAVASALALPAAGWVIEATGSYRSLFAFGGVAALAALVPLLAAYRPALTRLSSQLPDGAWWGRWLTGLVLVYASVLTVGLLIRLPHLKKLDETAFRWMNGFGPGPDVLWLTLNPPLRNYVALGLVAIVAAALAKGRSVWRVLALVALSGLLAWGLLEAVYAAYDRPRPEEVFAGVEMTPGHAFHHIESYPSGHTAIIGALVGAIGLVFPRLRLPLSLYAVIAAFARVLIGAHFPLDALAGLVLGYGSARLVYALLVEVGALREPYGEKSATSTRALSRRRRKELCSLS